VDAGVFWLTAAVRRRLLLATVASFGVPWLIGAFAKQFYQAGLHGDAVRAQLLIDFVVIGAIVFSLTMVLTVALGAWIHGVMKGPRHDGDPFPAGATDGLRDD
jgi:cation transporter-like permease